MNKEVLVCGIVEKIKIVVTKRKKQRMAILKIEDETSNIEAIVFPKLYEEANIYLKEKEIIVLMGNLESKDKTCKILASRIIPMEKIMTYVKRANIVIEKNRLHLDKLKDIFTNNRGNVPIYFSFKNSRMDGVKIKTADNCSIELTPQVLKDLTSLVGDGNLVLTL